MAQIFRVLALFALTFMVATMILGMSLGDVSDPYATTTQRWATVHRLSGIAAALGTLFVNSVVVTYFIGTSRWCKEVVETYSLDPAPAQRSTWLKRRTFPFAVTSMLIVVGIVALGGAADPAAALRLPPVAGLTWANLHLLGAGLGIALVAYTFYFEWTMIQANHLCIEELVETVRKIRIERGLEVD